MYVCVQPVYTELACSKCGSRVFDSLWDAASSDQRHLIAAALVERIDALRSNQFGRFIHDRCGLKCFTERPNDWKQFQMNDIRQRRLVNESTLNSTSLTPSTYVVHLSMTGFISFMTANLNCFFCHVSVLPLFDSRLYHWQLLLRCWFVFLSVLRTTRLNLYACCHRSVFCDIMTNSYHTTAHSSQWRWYASSLYYM